MVKKKGHLKRVYKKTKTSLKTINFEIVNRKKRLKENHEE